MTDAPQQQTTRLNPRWVLKMMIVLLVCLGLGIWGALDAFVIYPKRGRQHEQQMLHQYLEAAEAAARLNIASVEDPAAAVTPKPDDSAPAMDKARFVWLTSLSRVESLSAITRENREEITKRGDPSYSPKSTPTMFVDPRAKLEELRTKHVSARQAKALAAFDIPVQYLITAVGFIGAAWIALTLVRASRVKFQYDTGAKRLTLPDGRTVTPDTFAELDRRQWKRFFGHVRLTDGSPEIKLDLLRYVPLEDWVLELERLSPHTEKQAEPPPPEEPSEPQTVL